MVVRCEQGGRRRTFLFEIQGVRRWRSGQMVARWSLEAFGLLSVPDVWTIRRNDDVLFSVAADYQDAAGPRAYHRYIGFGPNLSRISTITAARYATNQIDESEAMNEIDEWLLAEKDLGNLELSPTESLSYPAMAWVRIPKKRGDRVVRYDTATSGSVHFETCTEVIIFDCSFELRGGTLRITAPRHPGSPIRPVVIEPELHEELALALARHIARDEDASAVLRMIARRMLLQQPGDALSAVKVSFAA